MPSIPQIIKMRRTRRERYRDRFYRRAGLQLATFASLLITAILFFAILIYTQTVQKLPSTQQLGLLLDQPNGFLLHPTQFLDRSGTQIIYEIQNPAITSRAYIQITDPAIATDRHIAADSDIANATIAISDPAFWQSAGYSLEGLRAIKTNTIAQRLVVDLLLWDEDPGIWRAMRERILAAQIVNTYGHTKILEWYLNYIDYGNLAFGIENAAQIYFGKSASELNLAEAVILAGTAESPAINPHSSPKIAIERGKIVLEAMVGQGLLPIEAAQNTNFEGIQFRPAVQAPQNPHQYFIEQTWRELTSQIPAERLERGGFRIITTLNYDLQIQADCTLQIHLARLSGNNDHLNPDQRADCKAAALLPSLTLNDEIAADLNANVVVYDPILGQILALVGAPNSPTNLPFENQTPGSLLTPYIYLTAFTRGYHPASLVWDIPLEIPNVPSKFTNPAQTYQGPVRLRNALANDYLIPAIQTTNIVGVANIFQIMEQSGLDSFELDQSYPYALECPGCQLLFGHNKIDLLNITQAFGIFANQGVLVGQKQLEDQADEKIHPISVLDIQDLSKRSQQIDANLDTRPVISAALAYLITDMLQDEAARWPSLGHPNPLEIGRPAGAKIGQTLDQRSNWTVGFTPQMVVGVWLGIDSPDSAGRIPTKASASLWKAIILHGTQALPAADWQIPPGISQLDVCNPSGMLPTIQCPNTVKEVFLTGQEPTQPDSLYQAYQINRETNRLATVFTPPELIEEQIYMNVPPEALAWAESVGLETPPETYDAIYTPRKLENANIGQPTMFAHLRGTVEIIGTVGGDDFLSYRLQAGEGVNPTGWVILQPDTTRPVEADILTNWDTSQLNGLYALQLIVLRDEQKVDTATIQVTVDNTPPELELRYPQNTQVFAAATDKIITFQVEAGDNLGLKSVAYWVDGQLVAEQTSSPFAYPWKSKPGDFELKIIATDLAGNTSQVEIAYTVE